MQRSWPWTGSAWARDGIVHRHHGPVRIRQEHVPESGRRRGPADLRTVTLGDTDLAGLNERRLTILLVRADRLRLPGLQPAADAHRRQNIGLPLRLHGRRAKHSVVREVAARMGLNDPCATLPRIGSDCCVSGRWRPCSLRRGVRRRRAGDCLVARVGPRSVRSRRRRCSPRRGTGYLDATARLAPVLRLAVLLLSAHYGGRRARDGMATLRVALLVKRRDDRLVDHQLRRRARCAAHGGGERG
jgi:hypothetical protein